jgi:hypothetical protein
MHEVRDLAQRIVFAVALEAARPRAIGHQHPIERLTAAFGFAHRHGISFPARYRRFLNVRLQIPSLPCAIAMCVL